MGRADALDSELTSTSTSFDTLVEAIVIRTHCLSLKFPHGKLAMIFSSQFRCRCSLSFAKLCFFRRLLTTTTVNPLSPPSSGHALLTTRHLISLTGHDASHFLQGLTTANIALSPIRNTGLYGAFLSASGRVLHDVFIYSTGEDEGGFLIEVDKDEVGRLATHLRRYKLRSKIKIRVLDEGELGVWSIWKDIIPAMPGTTLEAEGWRAKNLKIGCIDTRAPGMGWRAILSRNNKPTEAGDETSLGSYTVRRMLNGISEGQKEIIREVALPLECNMDYTSGVDFRKGCYVGQELTIRVHHTGVVRKRILPVQLYDGGSGIPNDQLNYDPKFLSPLPPLGTEIYKARKDHKPRSVGKWLGGVGNIGLALCRLETMIDGRLRGRQPAEREFEMRWTELEGGGEGRKMALNILAHLPAWLPAAGTSRTQS